MLTSGFINDKKKKDMKQKLKFFRIRENFSKKMRLNSATLLTFFLKSSVRKKKQLTFFKNLNKNIRSDRLALDNLLQINLLSSHLFFSPSDMNFFLKKGLVFLNGTPINNSLIFVKIGDRIQLVISTSYYMYINNFFKFFKKKIRFLRYKRWRFRKYAARNKYKNWNPDFLKYFFLYKTDVSSNLEIDYTTLTIIVIKTTTNIFKTNLRLLRLYSTYFSKSYLWKKIT